MFEGLSRHDELREIHRILRGQLRLFSPCKSPDYVYYHCSDPICAYSLRVQQCSFDVEVSKVMDLYCNVNGVMAGSKLKRCSLNVKYMRANFRVLGLQQEKTTLFLLLTGNHVPFYGANVRHRYPLLVLYGGWGELQRV